jgi:hypothetical protein
MNKYYINSKYVSISKLQKVCRLYISTLRIYTVVHTFVYTLKLIKKIKEWMWPMNKYINTFKVCFDFINTKSVLNIC